MHSNLCSGGVAVENCWNRKGWLQFAGSEYEHPGKSDERRAQVEEIGKGQLYHSFKGSVIAGLERLVESHAARDGRLSPAQVEATLIDVAGRSQMQQISARQLGYWAGASKTSASLLTGEGLIVDMGALQDVLATALAARHAAGVSHLERLLGIDYERRGRAYVQAGMRVGYERAQAVVDPISGMSAGRGGFAKAVCDGELSCDDAADVLMELMCMEERRIFAPGGCLFPFRRTRPSTDRQFDQLSRETRSVEDHLDAAAGLAADALESAAAVGAVMSAASQVRAMQERSQPPRDMLLQYRQRSATPALMPRQASENSTTPLALQSNGGWRSGTPALAFLHHSTSPSDSGQPIFSARFQTPVPL